MGEDEGHGFKHWKERILFNNKGLIEVDQLALGFQLSPLFETLIWDFPYIQNGARSFPSASQQKMCT